MSHVERITTFENRDNKKYIARYNNGKLFHYIIHSSIWTNLASNKDILQLHLEYVYLSCYKQAD